MSGSSPGRAIFLIARREFLSRVRSRVFVLGTALIVAALAAFVLLQVLVLNRINTNPPTSVAFVGPARALASPLGAAVTPLGDTIAVRQVADEAQGESEVRAGQLDVLINGTPTAPVVTVDDQLQPTIRTALDGVVQREALDAQLTAAGLDPAAVAARAASARVEVRALQPRTGRSLQQPFTGIVMALFLYAALGLYGTFIAQGVVEDKATRIVEILLSTIRPGQLLLGKVVGIGLVALLQLTVIGAAGLALMVPTGVLSVPAAAGGAVLAGLLWFVLGFFLYSLAGATAASLVSRQEDVQTVTMPVSLTLVVAWVLTATTGFPQLFGVARASTSTVVLSLLPPLAPMLMPVRMAGGDVPAWQVLLAIAIVLATGAALTWTAARVYANSVLRIGAPVRLVDAIRGR